MGKEMKNSEEWKTIMGRKKPPPMATIAPFRIHVSERRSEYESPKLHIRRANKKVQLPTKHTEDAVGWDLYSPINVTTPPFGMVVIPLKLFIEQFTCIKVWVLSVTRRRTACRASLVVHTASHSRAAATPKPNSMDSFQLPP